MSRVLIADPLDRVLLLHFRLWDGLHVWIPPGGGAEPGEGDEDAAMREVHEETGVALDRPLALVWVRDTHYFERDVRETYFFARVTATPSVMLEAAPGGPADLLEYRWWTLGEIAGATDEAEFTPPGIVERLEPLLSGEGTVTTTVIEHEASR